MKRSISTPIALCLFVLFTLALCVPVALAQETTAGIQGIVKDPSGAVVSNATAEISGPSLIGTNKATTDASGFYRFSSLPPGSFTLTITAHGFKVAKRDGIVLEAGRLPNLDIPLEIGQTSEVVEVTGVAPLVDVTQSKVAVTIDQAVLANIPKGRSFQSIIPFAPGARQEPMQSSRTDAGRLNGFQIDGASDAENVYMSEGLNTTAIYGGGVGANVPMEFVQEVQVKSSSFEAEFGGATGGVVNVIQRRGGPKWHGSVFTYYQGSPLNANDNCINRAILAISGTCNLRLQPGFTTNSGSVANLWADRLDAPAQRYVQQQDKWNTIEPGYEIGGALLNNRLWLFSSYVPSLAKVTRTVNFTGLNPGPHSFTQTSTTHNLMNRLDYRLTNSVRLFAAWQGGYNRTTGNVNMPLPDSPFGQVNTSAGTDPGTLRQDTGYVNPSTILNFGGDISIGSKMVVTARYGTFYNNNEDRGKTTGTRYVWQDDSTCDTVNNPFGCTLPPALQQSVGFANIPNNQLFSYDIFERRQFSTDAAYYVGHFGGTHNLKVGYSVQRLSENVLQTFNTSLVNIFLSGTDAYTTVTGKTQDVCASVIAKYGKCAGPDGYYMLRDGVNTNGNVSALNHSIYFQDGWTIKGLTINAGVRLDKEFLPPYRPGASSIGFGFGQKVAPRIGGAYDLLHNGKVKLYASYGKFFDIMKYSLPRGSFGGDRWHDCVYTLTTLDIASILPTNTGGKFCPDSGPAAGSLPGDFIENQNWRASAPGNPADPVVDPNMHPMSTHEYVAGADVEISRTLAFESRYARKRLDWTIEDMSLDDGQYYIGNPGSAYSQLLHRGLPSAAASEGNPLLVNPVCPTCPNLPKAIRNYDGLEFRLVRRNSQRWFGQLSYTYSRLYGNYAGLNNTYFLDGNGGRHEPNNGRAFDLPEMLFDGQGHAVGGPLPTDRPHVVSGVAYYRLKWWGMETMMGITQSIASGAPQSTCLPTVDSQSSCMFIAGQGNWINFHQDQATADIVQDSITKGKRMPILSSSDLSFTHEVKVSKSNEGMRLSFGLNVFNLFNQHAPITLYNSPLGPTTAFVTPATTALQAPLPWDYLSLMNNFDYMALMNDKTTKVVIDPEGVSHTVYGGPNTNGAPNTLATRYGAPVFYQNARAMRIQIKFTF